MPLVAIVGRPNAGKSTLFNRLVGRRKAMVHPTPGLTRDLNYETVHWQGKSLVIVDTGGLALQKGQPSEIDKAVCERSHAAVNQAQVVICVFDAKVGWSPVDADTVALVRERAARVIWVANKIDSPVHDDRLAEFYRAGVEDILPVSAEHGHGIDDLIDRALAALPGASQPREMPQPLAIAIVGRPNVGKSSLLNSLLGTERMIVDSAAGTTRDTIDTPLTWRGRRYLLVDTAGIRRRPKVGSRLEHLFVTKAIKALERSHIALVVFDAAQGVTAQDIRLCNLAWERGRGVVLVANKCDLLETRQLAIDRSLAERYPTFASVSVAKVSALSGTGVAKLMPLVDRVNRAHNAKLETPILNRVLAKCTDAHQPPVHRGRRVKLLYATQVGRRPPQIAIFSNYPMAVTSGYTKYLEKRICDAFSLVGTPIWLKFRGRR